MRIRSFLLPLAAVGFLAACQDENARRPDDVTQSNLDAITRKIKNDPALRQTAINECRANVRSDTAQQKANIAVLMKVTPEQAPVVFCDRMLSGFESGRLTAADVNSVKRGRLTPAALAVFQGE